MKRLIKHFSNENSLRGASLILIVTLALSNILGLFRDIFLTRNIPYSDSDIYFSAFRVPDTLFNFLVLGAITSAFIPIFTDYLAEKKVEDGYRLANLLITAAFILMVVAAILFYFLMPGAMRLIVPSFNKFRFDQTVHLSRIMMLSPVFFSASYVVGAVLNSSKRFLINALSPLVYNLSIIAGALLAPRIGLTGVAYFVVLGSFLHLLIQLPTLFKIGFKLRPAINLKDRAFRRVIKLMLPRSIGLGTTQILYTAYTAIGSSLALGSISAFNYSNNIQTVPVVVLGSSFAAALFPTLSQKISEGNDESFSSYLVRTIRAVAFLLIPVSVIMIMLRAQIIRMILGTGKLLTWDDTKMTAMALGLFSVSLLAQGLVPLLMRAFFALKNTKTPMYISLATVALSIAIAIPLSGSLSVAGLALSFSIGSFFQLFLLYYYLTKSYPAIRDASLAFSLAKTTLISLIMAFVVWPVMHLAAGYVDMTRFFGVLEQSFVVCLVGVTVFLTIAHLFGSEELDWVVRRSINGKSPSSIKEMASQQ